jgi:ABC-2 type transport system ATP-binding protein
VALDINAYSQFKQLVEHARNQGAALIISSHQLDTIDELCDRVGILRDGSVTEISQNGNDTASSWFIATDYCDVSKTILTAAGAATIHYDQGWHFSIVDPDKEIPKIVRLFVTNGLDIKEVRPLHQGFGSAIRILYGRKSEGKKT